jgi:hypothetical protein
MEFTIRGFAITSIVILAAWAVSQSIRLHALRKKSPAQSTANDFILERDNPP